MEHQKIYKFQNVAEGSFLDLHKGSTELGNVIKTWEPTENGSQKWRVNKEILQDFQMTTQKITYNCHGFRIASVRNDKFDVMKVLDQGFDDFGRVLYYVFHGNTNQQWECVPVDTDVYLIKNCWNDKVLKAQGIGNPVKCLPLENNGSDPRQQWRVLATPM